MSDRMMHCATCDAEMLFEVPPCLDGHDDDCPELMCTGCGAAILLAPIVVWAFSRKRGAQVPPQQRRAA